jgi:hypothetical protein
MKTVSDFVKSQYGFETDLILISLPMKETTNFLPFRLEHHKQSPLGFALQLHKKPLLVIA